MRLSEAILLGSVGSEQCAGYLIRDRKTCALGAAAIAVGISQLDDSMVPDAIDLTVGERIINDLVKEWPCIEKQWVDCPVCAHHANLHWIIGAHLNDQHKWTRPAIAAWVATIEPQEVLLLPDLTSTHLLEVGQQVELAEVRTT